MFQRLYRHLDNITEKLHKSQQDLQHTNKQVQEVNDHLAAINTYVSTQKKSTVSPLLVSNFCILAVMAAFFAFYVVRGPAYHVEPVTGVTKASTNELTQGQAREINEKIFSSQIHLQKLDSLINVEAQSLRELTYLNRVAVRTFYHIRKRLDDDSNALSKRTGEIPSVLAKQP